MRAKLAKAVMTCGDGKKKKKNEMSNFTLANNDPSYKWKGAPPVLTGCRHVPIYPQAQPIH